MCCWLIDPFAPILGDGFDVMNWGTLNGTFNTINLPGLDPGLVWNTTDLYNTGEISVTGLLGDANNDGVVSADDYSSVQLYFGDTAGLGGDMPVPEPATLFLLTLGGLVAMIRRRAVR